MIDDVQRMVGGYVFEMEGGFEELTVRVARAWVFKYVPSEEDKTECVVRGKMLT